MKIGIIGNPLTGLKNALIKKLSDGDIMVENFKRFHQNKGHESANTGVVPTYAPMRLVTLDQYKNAMNLAKNPDLINRIEYYRIAENAMLDLHLTSIAETRMLTLQATKWKLKNAKGEQDQGANSLLEGQWFLDFIQYAWEKVLYGHSLVELFEFLDDFKSVEMLTGKHTFRPLKTVELVPRKHVRPELGKWVVRHTDSLASGFSYLDEPNSHYYISVGKKKDLGLLEKIIPIALAKRYALASWGEYDEKLGIPFRYVTMQGTNPKREQLLAEILEKMGPAGWGIFHQGEEIKLLENAGNDVHKCFKELIELLDAQMSKVLLGGTMVVDAAGGQYKGEVHERTAEIRFNADKTFLEYLINDELIPKLTYLGYPLEGYRIEEDRKRELTLTEQIEIDSVLLTYYYIDPVVMENKYNLPAGTLKVKTLKQALNPAA